MDTSLDFNTPPSEQNESSISKIPKILPHERVFPIQIGTELFKLSGASLSSDGTRCSHSLPPVGDIQSSTSLGRGLVAMLLRPAN